MFGWVSPLKPISTICLRSIAWLTAQRTSGSLQGSLTSLKPSAVGHQSSQPYGLELSTLRSFSFGLRCSATSVSGGWRLWVASTWPAESSWVSFGSSKCGSRMIRFGAGRRRKPVLAPHQSSRRS